MKGIETIILLHYIFKYPDFKSDEIMWIERDR